MMRAALVVSALVAATIYGTLPARRLPLDAATAGPGKPLRGAFHVHTRRSDGTGTIEQVAAAAARAGLEFVVLTDHGDGTRLDSPVYLNGVLCIDAVEISTDQGHVVALGVQRTPYPLAGEPRDIIEDITRLGGMSIVAHPASEKAELRWSGLDLPFDGLEWLNGDSQWRDEPLTSLTRVLLTYWFRAPESLATLLDRPDELLAQWDALTARRPVVAIAGTDAHARTGLRGMGEPYDNAAAFHVPGYEQMFRVFSINVQGVRLTSDAVTDARAVVDAIRRGHVYTSIDALAGPSRFRLSAASAGHDAEAGDSLPAGEAVAIRAEVSAAPGSEIVLLKDGMRVASSNGATLEYTGDKSPAAYRIEVNVQGAPGRPPVPWVLSNPIYVRAPGAVSAPAAERAPSKESASKYENGPAGEWTVEKSDRSAGALDVVPGVKGTQLLMRYALAGATSENPYVAFVMPAGEIAAYDRLVFTGRASHPMRVSIQLRAPGATNAERWHRSVYLDDNFRTVTIFFDDMLPRGKSATRAPRMVDVRSVLFVVDQVNTALGTNGQIVVDDVKYAR